MSICLQKIFLNAFNSKISSLFTVKFDSYFQRSTFEMNTLITHSRLCNLTYLTHISLHAKSCFSQSTAFRRSSSHTFYFIFRSNIPTFPYRMLILYRIRFHTFLSTFGLHGSIYLFTVSFCE